MGGWSLSIDFGTSNTTAAVSDGQSPEVLEIENSRYLPSLVCATDDGELIVGRSAVAEAAVFPERAERVPKRALVAGDEVRLGGRTYRSVELVAAVVSKVVAEALRRHDQQSPNRTVLTYPARWGDRELRLMQRVASIAGLPRPEFVPEPIAAARHYLASQDVEPGRCVAVYDLGGGTLDTAVLRRTEDGFALTGPPGGDATLGGEDLDTVMRTVIGTHATALDAATWDTIWTADDRRSARVQAQWRRAITEAKEALSSCTSVTVWQEGFDGGIRVTRAEYEAASERLLRGSVAELADTVRRAGLGLDDLAAVYLTGGASRTPQISDLISEMLGVLPRTTGDPKAAVALGALARPDGRTRTAATTARPTAVAALPLPTAPATSAGRTALPAGWHTASDSDPAPTEPAVPAVTSTASAPPTAVPPPPTTAAPSTAVPTTPAPSRPTSGTTTPAKPHMTDDTDVPRKDEGTAWPVRQSRNAVALSPPGSDVPRPAIDPSLFRDERPRPTPRQGTTIGTGNAQRAVPATRLHTSTETSCPTTRPTPPATSTPPRATTPPPRPTPPPPRPPAFPMPPTARPRRRGTGVRVAAALVVIGGLIAAGAIYGPRIADHLRAQGGSTPTTGSTTLGTTAGNPGTSPSASPRPSDDANSSTSSTTVPQSMRGSWAGDEQQTNLNHTTQVSMTLSATGGSAEYGSGACEDTLQLDTATAASATFAQTTANSGCLDGTVTVTLNGSALTYSFRSSGGGITGYGTLHR